MQAYLILANGRVFRGVSVGCPGTTIGEVVFATGMVGFEETLTDPSYYGQIITQTYPLIGNYGMNSEDVESTKIWARGYIVREACKTPSNFRSEETLDAFLKKNGIIGIEGIDTRSLTRTLRESGVMNGAITTEFDPDAEPEKKAALLPEIAAYAVVDAVKTVTCREAVTYEPTAAGEWGDTAAELAALNPDGIMLSNGPGDPAENVEIIANIREMLSTGIPTFGICLGHQLTALAAGAKTCKLKYGHRGTNQPVSHISKSRTFITSQNHGYAVMADTLPESVGQMSYFNANDGTCEGVDYLKWNCFTVQFHPEANGGPKDTEFLFDQFVSRMLAAKGVINNA